jgi:hypothetical protein
MKINGVEFKPVDLNQTVRINNDIPTISIKNERITFNSAFGRCLNFPSYVELYASPENKLIAFKGLKSPTQFSHRLFKKSDKPRKAKYVYLSGKRFITFMQNITRIENGKIIGKFEDGYIIFNLKEEAK